VMSIAFGIPTAAVDGNVCRVFSRVFLISGDLTRKEGKDLIW
jgi:adenine-specific DNA glycosylase